MTTTHHFAKSETDPFFNDRAAKAAFELVMKMDEDEARLFTTMAVADELWGLIEKNQATLQRHLDEITLRSLDRIKKGLDRTVVAKRMNDEPFDEEKALATAGAIAVIEKAVRNPYAYGYVYDETDFRRGRDGRFTTKIKPKTGQKPMSNGQAKAMDIPKPAKKDGKHLTGEQRAKYQAQYLQVAAALSRFDPSDDATIVVQDGAGRVSERRLAGANGTAAAAAWDPYQEDVVAVSVAPKNLTVGGAGFELVSALGGSPQTAAMRGEQLQAVDASLPNFSREWANANASSGTNSTDRLYGRLEAGSKFVSQVAPVGTKVQLAAKFGEFVGQRGPEAESVIGPSARKTAYRYRGVSKAPDAQLAREYERRLRQDLKPDGIVMQRVRNAQSAAIKAETNRMATRTKTPVDAVRLPEAKRKEVMERAEAKVLATYPSAQPSDAARTQARREVGDTLARKGPKGSLYELQLASGHLPPSEGVIINSAGKMVAQAVGYADDHYLPFNLKQLGALKGGEYIRTRSVGGPTSEDIYTGLMTGAKAITVASRSGTFEIEFQDDFVGGRRYNDKAKRMVDRYEKLLDAVESGQVKRAEQVNPAIKQQIENQLAEDDPNYRFYSPRDRREVLREAVEAYRKDPEWTDADEAAVSEIADRFVTRHPDYPNGREYAEQRARNDLKEAKELNYQLNARGYEAALKALKEQFPYYIKDVRRNPREADEQLSASSKDRGYVKPRFNRPAAARASYFDSSITGDKRVMADQVDYQNNRVARTRAPQQESVAEPVEAGGDDDAARRTDAAAKAKENLKTERQKEGRAKLSDTAAQILSAIHGVYGEKGEMVPGKGESKDNVVTQLTEIGTPEQLAEEIRSQGETGPRYKNFARFVDFNKGSLFAQDGGLPDGEFLGTQWDSARGLNGGVFNRDEPFVVSKEAPATFDDGDAYNEATATASNVPAEMRKRDQQSIFDAGFPISDMSDAELVKQIEGLGALKRHVETAKRAQERETDQKAKTAAFNRYMLNAKIDGEGLDVENNPTYRKAINHPDKIGELAENVHRMRALQRVREAKGFPSPREQAEGDVHVAEANGRQTAADTDAAREWARNQAAFARRVLANAAGSDDVAESDARDALVILERAEKDGVPPGDLDVLKQEVGGLLSPHMRHGQP